MKTFLSLFLLASAAAASIEADNASLSGKWKVHNSIQGNESDVDCTFVQKDNELSGSCVSDNGDSKATGKVEGTKISWSYDTQYNGGPLTVKYSGTLDSASAKIAGTVTVEQYGVDGDFTAILAK
jgi:hypothetical protein